MKYGPSEFTYDEISVPLRAYNGVDDGSVNFNGAYKNIKKWVELENKGDPSNKVSSNITIDDYTIEVTKWTEGMSDIEFYALQDTGHSISWGSIGESMWDFMKSHIKD